MHIRTKLLAAVATSALLASGAQAAPAKKKHHAAASSNANRELLEEVRALREQVNEMKQRLDVQESAQVNTQETATAAQTQAAAAVTQAQAAQTQAAVAAQAVPTEVKTALAANKPKPQWFDSTSISGRMYFNFSNISQKANGAKSTANGTGFNIKRFYLGVDHTFSPIFSANVTMDVSNVVGQTSNGNFATPAANTSTGALNNVAIVGRGFYIKKAYLQAKLNPALIIRLGAADMPWIPYDENQYGYRHVEYTLIDRTSYGTSSDWGIHVLGDIAGGLISYQVSAVDGGGYRNVKVTNTVDFEGRLSASYKGVYAAVGGYSGKRGNDVQNALLPNGGKLHTATRFDAMGGYKTKLFNVGAEYFSAKNWNNVNTNAEDKADGYSVFGNVNFMPKWSVFGRYDWVKPNKLTNPNLKDHYYNVGIQWEPVKIVDLALTYKRDSVDNGLFSTQNGTIGGANPTGSLIGGHGTYSEIGLFGQLRF